MLAEFKEIKARVFNAESDTCPTCGSKWPLEKVEEFEKHFNVEKAKAIEEKQRKWNCFKNLKFEKYQKAIEELNNKIKYLGMEKGRIISRN